MTPAHLPGLRSLRSSLAAVRERTGAPNAEIHVKAGSTRHVTLTPRGALQPLPSDPGDLLARTAVLDERGWALRAGSRGRALFLADSGPLPQPNGWRRLTRHSLRRGRLDLPPPPRTKNPAEQPPVPAADLEGEADILGFLHHLVRRLRAQMPEIRLLRARLEVGSSASILASSTGVTGRASFRLASVQLDVGAPRDGRLEQCSLHRAASCVDRLDAGTVASEVAERLGAMATPAPPFISAGEIAVSPAMSSSLLSALAPLFRGRDGWRKLNELAGDRSVGPQQLQIIDDGGLPGGWFAAAADDEGVPTREVRLVQDGAPGEPLLGWQDDGWSGFSAAGCRRRAGWRSPPEFAHSHLYIAAGDESSHAIRNGIVQGCYLIGRPHNGHLRAAFDTSPDEARFEVEAIGVALRRGVVQGGLPRVRLSGSVRQLLQGIRAIGRDLCFVPEPGPVGAPTLLLTGLQLEPVSQPW